MLSHVDNANQPTMVDVGDKEVARRTARAQSIVRFPQEILHLFDGSDLHTKKGPVLATAIVAGTMAVKQTSALIPFCHPLAVESCKFTTTWLEGEGVKIECEVQIHGKTGVEMEALTGVSIAALTVYDMCKALSHKIEITGTILLSKDGGKSSYSRGEEYAPS